MSSAIDTDNENTDEAQSIGSTQAPDLSNLQENFSQQQVSSRIFSLPKKKKAHSNATFDI